MKKITKLLKDFEKQYKGILGEYREIISSQPLTKFEYEAAYKQLKDLEVRIIDLKNQVELVHAELTREYNTSLAGMFEYGREWKSYKELELLSESTNPGVEELRQYINQLETYSRTCEKLLQSIGTMAAHLISLCPKE